MRTLFRDLKVQETEKRKLFGNTYTENDYIFKWNDGHLFSTNHASGRFRELLKLHGLSHIRFMASGILAQAT